MSQHPSSIPIRAAGLAWVALIALASSALAQAVAPTIDATASSKTLPPYDTLDSNKDGVVTLPEVVVFSPPLAKRIAHCDSNGNKALSREEYASCEAKPREKPAPLDNGGSR